MLNCAELVLPPLHTSAAPVSVFGGGLGRRVTAALVALDESVLVAHDAAQRLELLREVVAAQRLLAAAAHGARHVPVPAARVALRRPRHLLWAKIIGSVKT